MQDIPFRSAKQLASLIRRRKIGCLELLDLYLARMARHAHDGEGVLGAPR